MPATGSKKISSSQPLAASGDRRNGTITTMARRAAHSAAMNTLSQKPESCRKGGKGNRSLEDAPFYSIGICRRGYRAHLGSQ